jgi:hypothetical protein
MKSNRLHQLSAAIGARLQQFEEIPLKDEGGGDYCGISSCGPTLYVSGRKDDKVFNLPKTGSARINYRIRSKSVNYRENGDERYSTDIEVQTIDPTGFEAILGKYDFSERSRDDGGRFAPGQNVSADDMAAAYLKPKKKERGALLAGAGAAGLATAAVASPKARQAIAGGVGRLVRQAV